MVTFKATESEWEAIQAAMRIANEVVMAGYANEDERNWRMVLPTADYRAILTARDRLRAAVANPMGWKRICEAVQDAQPGESAPDVSADATYTVELSGTHIKELLAAGWQDENGFDSVGDSGIGLVLRSGRASALREVEAWVGAVVGAETKPDRGVMRTAELRIAASDNAPLTAGVVLTAWSQFGPKRVTLPDQVWHGNGVSLEVAVEKALKVANA